MYEIEIKPKAAAQIREAAIWYTKKQKEIGLFFLNEIESAFDAISINPFYAIRYKDLRGFVLKKFPFLILYRINEKQMAITIFAVFHTAQDPNKYPQ